MLPNRPTPPPRGVLRAPPHATESPARTRDLLHTPFGVYVLIHELTARARHFAGGNRLLVTYMATCGGSGATKGGGWRPLRTDGALISKLGRDWNLPSDEPDKEDNPLPMRPLRLETLRTTDIELHQKPVAHTR